MAKDLGKSYKIKNTIIKYPNGDIYDGMAAAYHSSDYEPHGEGVYFNKSSGVSFKADWEWREGPDFNTIEIVNKPEGESFVLINAYAGEIYSDLVYLGIIKAKPGTYHFKELESFILEPHAWSNHLFTIKQADDKELVFDFTGPKVDHGKFVDCVAKKGEAKELHSTVSSHIIWDHDDEYDVSKTAKINVLYF